MPTSHHSYWYGDVCVDFGHMLTYLGIISTITRVAFTQTEFPAYRVRFGIYYNTSDVVLMSETCGTYYAQSFLVEFSKADQWMEAECQKAGKSGINVKIPNRATVKLFWGQVEVDFDILLSLSVTERNLQDLVECGKILNASLRNPESISVPGDDNDKSLIDRIRNVDQDDVGTNCTAAVMSPVTFYFQEAAWHCSENYTFSEIDGMCLQNERVESAPAPTPRPETPNPERVFTTFGENIQDTTASEHLTSEDEMKEPFLEVTTTPSSAEDSITSVTPKTVTSQSEGTSVSNPRQHYGIDVLYRSNSLRLEEGQIATPLDLHVWVDHSALCQGAKDCRVSLNATIASGDYSGPICRRTGQLIPQVVMGRPLQGTKQDTSFCSMPISEDQSQRNITLLLRAVSDNKYDGRQERTLMLGIHVIKDTMVYAHTTHRVPVIIEDRDRKATCQSINDPHISTFDGLQYNNYYEGEFVLYSHKELPATVHVVFQRCSSTVQASCNCAVAVQSGDDVILIDRCFRDRKHLERIGETSAYREINPMSVKLFLNGKLTPGTRIYQESDGKKYYIYLPHGAYIKVIISGLLVNAWIVASPADLNKTKGLCGNYDKDKSTDLVFPNGTYYHDADIMAGSRDQPVDVMMEWRVPLDSSRSLLRGVRKLRIPYEPPRYCQCQEDAADECAHSMHVDNCDVIQGTDVTDWLVRNAEPPRIPGATGRGRRNIARPRRDIEDNTISIITRDDPIRITKDFVPPKYKWGDNSKWNEASAKDFCTQYIRDNYTVGQLCSEIVPAVNFKQEIDSCTEDIQITKSTDWAGNARHAMKEQCLEEIQKNSSLPDQVAGLLQDAMCFNDCSGNGNCIKGKCICEAGYTSSDCSVSETLPPYASELPHYGLCDIRNMNCSRVIVYGDNFVESETLMCFFQECEVSEQTYHLLDKSAIGSKGLFINFNAVECTVPNLKPYLISISNNAGLNKSKPLLFLPFDPNCRMCNPFNTSCIKLRNSCIIDGLCYSEGESSPEDECLLCEPINSELQWTTQDGMKCRTPWWEHFKLPSWAVAVPAAVGGSIVGILAGFLLYKCCCKNNKQRTSGVSDMTSHHNGPDEPPFEDAILHRNRGPPVFNGNQFSDLGELPRPEQQRNYDESYNFYNDGRGVENGVDSTTYF